jgi:predicted regulator of Ras-like GTPase activity (Roadblock/LC7/MglB family)
MLTLPQLLEADVEHIGAALRDLLKLGDATTALLTDQAGFLITHQGDDQEFDLTTIAALASGAYMANQSIANLIHEENFSCTYQQGERHSLLVTCVDEQCLLLVIFPAPSGVGAVKYYAPGICHRIAAQLQVARQRDPAAGVDLATLNLADSESLFKRKA